eukprot:TRINITY_DN68_c0_g1_i2.p1 TRINITY_DN68_c0_g1~~TRINITY_DN68_c0_g1_i2.p1  ORF type:complete len:141 (+),score=46.81 TRINITY_DN68_c0_g1_i2:19-441(+)
MNAKQWYQRRVHGHKEETSDTVATKKIERPLSYTSKKSEDVTSKVDTNLFDDDDGDDLFGTKTKRKPKYSEDLFASSEPAAKEHDPFSDPLSSSSSKPATPDIKSVESEKKNAVADPLSAATEDPLAPAKVEDPPKKQSP